MVSDLVHQGFLHKKDGLSIHRERYLQFFREEQFERVGSGRERRGEAPGQGELERGRSQGG